MYKTPITLHFPILTFQTPDNIPSNLLTFLYHQIYEKASEPEARPIYAENYRARISHASFIWTEMATPPAQIRGVLLTWPLHMVMAWEGRKTYPLLFFEEEHLLFRTIFCLLLIRFFVRRKRAFYLLCRRSLEDKISCRNGAAELQIFG